MDNEKNYTGKIIKIYYKDNNGKEQTQTGIVMSQRTLPSGKPQMNMLLTDGREWLSTYFNVEKITSARLDEQLRSALTQYYKAKVDQAVFLDTFQKQKAAHEKKVRSALQAVRDFSGTLSFSEFLDAVEALFKDTFRREEDHSGWLKKYFRCTSCGQNEVTIGHIQDIQKYASPEEYSFIRREYDGCLFIEPDTPGFKQFCERNAPAEIPALKGKCKTELHASIGDKNWLTVERLYTFPLTKGISKQSLKDLTELLRSPVKSKLSDRISSIEERKVAAGKSSTKDKTKKADRGR